MPQLEMYARLGITENHFWLEIQNQTVLNAHRGVFTDKQLTQQFREALENIAAHLLAQSKVERFGAAPLLPEPVQIPESEDCDGCHGKGKVEALVDPSTPGVSDAHVYVAICAWCKGAGYFKAGTQSKPYSPREHRKMQDEQTLAGGGR